MSVSNKPHHIPNMLPPKRQEHQCNHLIRKAAMAPEPIVMDAGCDMCNITHFPRPRKFSEKRSGEVLKNTFESSRPRSGHPETIRGAIKRHHAPWRLLQSRFGPWDEVAPDLKAYPHADRVSKARCGIDRQEDPKNQQKLGKPHNIARGTPAKRCRSSLPRRPSTSAALAHRFPGSPCRAGDNLDVDSLRGFGPQPQEKPKIKHEGTGVGFPCNGTAIHTLQGLKPQARRALPLPTLTNPNRATEV